MPWKTWKMCRWCVKAVIKQHWSSYQWCNISWTIWIYFLRKKVYLRQRGQKVNTRLFTPRITQWNQIWEIMQMIWWTNKTVYSEWNSCKNVFICRKRSKCLLFKMDEKIVRTTLPKFSFFEPCRSKNQAFRR